MKNKLDYFWQKKTLLSFFAVIFVIIIHNSTTAFYNLDQGSLAKFTNNFHDSFAYILGSIAVPLFFFLAGFTFFRNFKLKDYPRKIKSRFKSLLLPYLIWNTLALLFFIVVYFTPLKELISGREMFEPSIRNVFEGIFLYKYNFQFWFLYDLMIYVLLTPLIYLLIYKKPLGLLSLILVFLLPLLTTSFLKVNLYFTIFYFLGCLLGKYCLAEFTKKSSKKISLIAGFFFCLVLALKTMIFYGVLNPPFIISNLLTIFLLLSFWFFSDLFISKFKPHTFYKEFFPIFTIHTYFLPVFIKIFLLILPLNAISMLSTEIITTLLTVIFTTAVAYFWHKKLPRLYNIVFGARP